MLSELELDLLNSLNNSSLLKFLNGGTVQSSVLKEWNRSDQEWLEFLDSARAHIRWERIQAINSADDVYYFTTDNSDARERAKEIVLEQSKNQVKVNKGSGGFSYLFLELDSVVQDPFRLKELKSLVLDSRPSKSKWASDEKLGQEPLYEAFEKVLGELRNYSEHALPFLKPVQRREAPNYYDVIKNPMDLGTMGKKLKNLEYKSKEEFWKDLNLIWSNCLAYNTLPESIYRKHANAMRQKADELMKAVPEISVKTGIEDSDDDDGSKIGTAAGSVNGDAAANTRRPLTFVSVQEEQDTIDVDINEESVDTPGLDGQKDDDTHQSDQGEDDDDYHTLSESSWESIQFQKWKELSVEQRALIYKRHFIEAGVRFENKKAFVRTPEGMLDFFYQESEYVERMKRMSEDSSAEMTTSDCWERAFLPELMPPTSIMPHITQPYNKSEIPVMSLSKVAAANLDISSNIYKKVNQNIMELNEIKHLYYSIEGESFTPALSVNMGSMDPFVSLSANLGKVEASKILGRSISLIMNHSGFDGKMKIALKWIAIYESALCTFIDLVTEYISNFGKNIKLCLDGTAPIMSTEEIIQFALSQNGIHDFNVLHSYILEIVSQGKRLSNIKNYLTATRNKLQSVIHIFPHLQKQMMSSVITDEEENELIMSGNYLSALGIDIFNVKESGIDISGVPLELWNVKALKQISSVDDRLASPLTGHRVQDISSPFDPIFGKEQIGLLKEFFDRPESALIEDDQKPNVKSLKSKVMVRAAMLRKRLVIGTDNLPKKKKKSIASSKD